MIAAVVVFAALVAVALLAGRLGADSRPHDPGCADTQWPFARHDG